MKSEVYKIGKTLGLNKKDIDCLMSRDSSRHDSSGSSDLGVEIYKAGGKYGTISTYEVLL